VERAIGFAILPAALSSCASQGTPADAPPVQLSLDVVITDEEVTLYTNGSDLDQTDCDGQSVFPAPGMTAYLSDTFGCTQPVRTCLTSVSVRLGATEVLAPYLHPGREITLEGSVAAAGGGELRLEGCGDSAVIGLPVVSAPRPTLSVVEDPVSLALTSTWSATPDAASALIEVINSTWGDAAHVTASPYLYAGRSGVSLGAYRVVALRAFAAPTVVSTSFGAARIWTAGSTFVIVEETATHIP